MISDRSWADDLFVSYLPIPGVWSLTSVILDHPLFPVNTLYPSSPDPALIGLDHTESAFPAYVHEAHLGALH